MQKKRKFIWKSLMLWSLVFILATGVSGLLAVNYSANKVIDAMARSIETEITVEPSSSNQSALPTVTESKTTSMNQGSDSVAIQPGASQQNGQASSVNTSSEQPSGKVDSVTRESDKVGVYSSEVSTNKVKAIKEEVTIAEKASVTSILMRNLNLSDLKMLQEMAGGGMTVDEKRDARKVLLEKLSPEEYNKLVAIAKKYGVSRGKNYDEAEKEEAEAAK
ncbi:hypothetical protein SD71_13810 [Cohnella kolymensis]|uniref:Uncharacterized protein n=1 Tax=Cohnella kolymensis TaxID=1590652 RepID=A0ABR5A2W1_9BACL|nr:hypothetical protein [Cohnella kolymensis]KIL35386.1 hypothetical protein SD71_13810 [Cohnella kolymensis]